MEVAIDARNRDASRVLNTASSRGRVRKGYV